jgi:hypothetical protein
MRRLSTLVLFAMLTSAAHADAERTIAMTVGAGAANDRFSSYQLGRSISESRWGASVDVDISARLVDQLAVGVHVGVSRSGTSYDCDTARLYFSVTPVLVGAVAQYTVFDRVWIAPWVGVLDMETHYSHFEGKASGSCGYGDEDVERRFAYGVGIGADVYENARHRVGAYAQIARARASTQIDTYPDEYAQDILLSVGIAYRYW